MNQQINLFFDVKHNNLKSYFILKINNIQYQGTIYYDYYDDYNIIIDTLNLIFLRVNNKQYINSGKKIYLLYNDNLDLYFTFAFTNSYNNLLMRVFDLNKINKLNLYLKTETYDNDLYNKININSDIADLDDILAKKLIIN